MSSPRQQCVLFAVLISVLSQALGFSTLARRPIISGSIRTHQQRCMTFQESRFVERSRSKKTTLKARKDATFGMGCFWKPSEELLKVPGVIDTVVGYTGNPYATKPPSYEQVCFSRDPWVEGVRVVYDDTEISYDELLNEVFDKHEAKIGSRQYSSIIFTHDKEQETIAKQWIMKNEQTVRNRDGFPASFTAIESLPVFYKAEAYHQQYWQKTRPRIAGMIALLALSSGALDGTVIPNEFVSMAHTIADALVIVGLLYVLFERKIDTKTVEI